MRKKTINEILSDKNSYFITGGAGTGKSTLLLSLVLKIMKEGKIKYQALSPTGIAAQMIGGKTLHSFLNIDPRMTFDENIKNIKLKNYFTNDEELQLVIIDEISMVTVEMFRYLDTYLRFIKKSDYPFGGVKLIVFGDFLQLPPINDEESKFNEQFVFETQEWKELIKNNVIVLQENHRAENDKEFQKLLNIVREGKQDEAYEILNSKSGVIINEEKIIPSQKCSALFQSNALVDEYNNKVLEDLGEEVFTSTLRAFGLDRQEELDHIVHENPILNNLVKVNMAVGAEIMFIKNDYIFKRYFNGTRGVIKKINLVERDGFNDIESVEVEINGKLETIEKRSFRSHTLNELDSSTSKVVNQFPFKLAYAFTVHKSQGQTITNDILISLENSETEIEGMMYTALSRAKSFSQIKILDFKKEQIKQSPVAIEYWNDVKEGCVSLNQDEFVKEVVNKYVKNCSFKGEELICKNSKSLNDEILNELDLNNPSFKYYEDKLSVDYNGLEDLFEFDSRLDKDKLIDLKRGEELIYTPDESTFTKTGYGNATIVYRNKKEGGTQVPAVTNLAKKIKENILGEDRFPEPTTFAEEVISQERMHSAADYGNNIDLNKNLAITEGKVEPNRINLISESLFNLQENGLQIIAVNKHMIHPELKYHGEVDTILYHKDTDTYYISDTKTNKDNPLNKEEYLLQVQMYAEILRKNNPKIHVSNICIIEWLREDINIVKSKSELLELGNIYASEFGLQNNGMSRNVDFFDENTSFEEINWLKKFIYKNQEDDANDELKNSRLKIKDVETDKKSNATGIAKKKSTGITKIKRNHILTTANKDEYVHDIINVIPNGIKGNGSTYIDKNLEENLKPKKESILQRFFTKGRWGYDKKKTNTLEFKNLE